MRTSVAAAASRPLGPAATEASPPSFTLLFSNDIAPLGFTTRSTKSVPCTPIWNPRLAPSQAYNAGGPHGPVKFEPPRQVMAPRPQLSPHPNARFLPDGMTMTHSAQSSQYLGIITG